MKRYQLDYTPAILCLVIALSLIYIISCRASWDYSPLDEYVKTINKRYEDSVRESNANKQWIDSVHQLNH